MGPLMAPILADMQVYMGPELAVKGCKICVYVVYESFGAQQQHFCANEQQPEIAVKHEIAHSWDCGLQIANATHKAAMKSSTRHYHMTPSTIPHSSPSELDDTKTVQTGSLSRDPVVSMKFEGHY